MQTRNTIQRQIVLQAVNQMHNHPTADAIYAVIAAQHQPSARPRFTAI